MKKTVILIGDKIITNKTAECGEGKEGKIICQHYDNDSIYGIKFDFKDSSFHKLQYEKKDKGILNENEGLWLEKNDFKVIPISDENKRQFNSFMMTNFLKTIEKIPEEIKRSKNIIESQERSIKEREEYNKTSENEIEKYKKIIEELKNEKNPNPENYFQWYEKLKKHPDIKDIIIKDNYIIIQTNDLIYHHQNDLIEDFDLGAYYIFIPNDINSEIRAINYKRQYYKGNNFHPCIKYNGVICMGDNVRADISKYRKENQLLFLVYLLINFLKEPNYNRPYLTAEKFRCSQNVTYKPINIFDYLSDPNWKSFEKFNEKKFYKSMIEFYEKDIIRFKEKNINLNYIDQIESYIRNFKTRI